MRKLVIWSEQLARLNARARERRLEKAQEQLQALRAKLDKRTLISTEAIEAAKNKILNSCKVDGLMDAGIVENLEIVLKKNRTRKTRTRQSICNRRESQV